MFTVHVNMSVVTCLTSAKPVLNKRLIDSHCKTTISKVLANMHLSFDYYFLLGTIP